MACAVHSLIDSKDRVCYALPTGAQGLPENIATPYTGNNFAVRKLDVTNDALVKEVVESVVKEYGSVDVLINNAGYGTLISVEQMPLKQHQDLFDTNYFGMVSRKHLRHTRYPL